MNKTKVKKIIGLTTLGFLLLPLMTFALTAPTPPVSGEAVDLDEIEDLINGIARFLIIVSVIIAVIFIIWGGVRWIAARGNPEAVKAAQQTILNGIYGSLIVLGVGVILQTLSGVISRAVFGTYNQ